MASPCGPHIPWWLTGRHTEAQSHETVEMAQTRGALREGDLGPLVEAKTIHNYVLQAIHRSRSYEEPAKPENSRTVIFPRIPRSRLSLTRLSGSPAACTSVIQNMSGGATFGAHCL